MTPKRMATRVKKLVAGIAGAGLLAGGVLLAAPEVGADHKRGRGSVRHSSKARPADPRGARDPRGPADPRGVRDPRGPADPRGVRDPRGPLDPRNPRGRANRRYARYSAWEDARRDYRRWRTITGLFKLGVYLATKPPRSTSVIVTGTTYYYAGGVYYVASGSGYVVVAPPPGAVVYAVPTSTTVVYVGSTSYYYYGGTYYVVTTAPAQPPPAAATTTTVAASSQGVEALSDVPMTDDEQSYEVVAPPVGATVPYVPDEASEEVVNGKKYMVYDGTYYRPFASDGDTVYMVVEDPRQA